MIAVAPDDMPWVTRALCELGTNEREHAELISRAYHGATRGGPAPASVAWCGSFLSFVFTAVGIANPRSKSARAWLKFGSELDVIKPGCVVVYKRGPAPQGHVQIVLHAAGDTIWGIGGNQRNAVSVDGRHVGDVLGARWPGER